MNGLIYYATAFGLGAAHALEPGHGKTLVAAYLTGTQGKVRDALLLGLLVTVFHTASVFVLGALGAFLAGSMLNAQHGMQQNLLQSAEVLSGLMILGIGLTLFWRRFIRDQQPTECECHLVHHHQHDGHDHAPNELLDDQIEAQLKQQLTQHPPQAGPKTLLSLGFASGLSPCPTALAALIASITLGGFGKLPEALGYLFIFSLGLGVVLTSIGLALVLSGSLASRMLIQKDSRLPVWISRISTVLIIGLGLYLTLKGLFFYGPEI